jgi:hypothetical protein
VLREFHRIEIPWRALPSDAAITPAGVQTAGSRDRRVALVERCGWIAQISVVRVVFRRGWRVDSQPEIGTGSLQIRRECAGRTNHSLSAARCKRQPDARLPVSDAVVSVIEALEFPF